MSARAAPVRTTSTSVAPADGPVGYTLGWDLVRYEERGVVRAPAVNLSPDRALIVLGGEGEPLEPRGRLVFPDDSGLAPISTALAGSLHRIKAGDGLATLRLRGISIGMARLMLAWLHARVSHGQALPADTGIADVERITDPERIERILALLSHTRAKATVTETAAHGSENRVPARLDADGSLLIRWERARPLQAPLRVHACGYNSVYDLVWPDSPEFSSSVAEIVRIRRRRFRRAPAPVHARIRFRHPLWPDLQVDAPLKDVSVGGVAFTTNAIEALLYPGLALEAVVSWKGGPSIPFHAHVRHVTPSAENREHICGLALQAADSTDAAWWADAVECLLQPTTHRHTNATELWRLYEESGYFALSGKAPGDFLDMRAAFDARMNRTGRGAGVVVHFGVRSQARLEAAVGQLEAWAGSWLVFQGARRGEDRPLSIASNDVLRDLYARAYEHVLHRADARYLVSYVQDVARFSKMCQFEFGTRLARSGAASVSPFRAIELDSECMSALDLGGALVTPARPAERRWIARVLTRNRSAHYLAGTGLAAPDLGLGEVVSRWRTWGLSRKREVFLVRDGVAIDGALIVESADDGLHLFGLLDVVRWVSLRPGGRRSLPGGLVAAARWYAAQRKRRFVYFEEEEPDEVPSLPLSVDLGRASMIVSRVQALPEFLEHVFEITAPPRSSRR